MLVHYTDEVLHKPCIPFNFESQDAVEIANELSFQKNQKNGYGLAAPQIGLPFRVFAFLREVAFNPEVLEASQIEEQATEGCLSYPGLWITLKRPKLIKVRYFTEENKEVIRDLDQLETRVFLHELDHIDGVTMVDRASSFKLRRAVEHANKHGSSYNLKELKNEV